MVAVDPVHLINMQRYAAIGAESLKKLTHQFAVKTANLRAWKVNIPYQKAATSAWPIAIPVSSTVW